MKTLVPAACLALAACSSASPPEVSATSSEALTPGTPSPQPVVEIAPSSGAPCSGTALTDSWILSSHYCFGLPGQPEVTSGWVRAGGDGMPWVAFDNIVFDADAALLHLSAPITFASYPTIATIEVQDGRSLTCASAASAPGSWTDGLPEQATFTAHTLASRGFLAVTPQGNVVTGPGDIGGACFLDDGTLAAVLAGCEPSLCGADDTWDHGEFIYAYVGPAPICGSATCGWVPVGNSGGGGTLINCGTCQQGTVCNAGSCIVPPQPPPNGCPRGEKDCGDGVCVPMKQKCW